MKPKARKGAVNHDLREQRLLRRWSQQDVAERIETTTNNVSR